MKYTNEQLNYVLAYLDNEEPKLLHTSNPIKVDLNLDGNNGTLTGYSNKAWNYKTTGISFNYSYGTDHVPGSICGHNICMCVNRRNQDNIKFWSDGYFHDSAENQEKLRDLFIDISSDAYQVSVDIMLEVGRNIVENENKHKAWGKYCDYITAWAAENKASHKFPKPMTFAAWYKKNK